MAQTAGQQVPVATTTHLFSLKGAFDVARKLASGKKKRFREAGFDLDLTYINPRLIAMGYPSTGFEAVYRNPLCEVQRLFAERHAGHVKVYNLCSERDYDLKGYFPLVERYPFDDHNPCALEMLPPLLDSMADHLAEDPKSVVAVHCKAGKGRTGLVVSAYLLHTGACSSAAEALKTFADRRTCNGQGVTIPSQRRYVHYYERWLRGDVPALVGSRGAAQGVPPATGTGAVASAGSRTPPGATPSATDAMQQDPSRAGTPPAAGTVRQAPPQLPIAAGALPAAAVATGGAACHGGSTPSRPPRLAPLPRVVLQLTGVRLNTVPNFPLVPGSSRCSPYFKVYVQKDIGGIWQPVKCYSYKRALRERTSGAELESYEMGEKYIYLDCSRHDLLLCGNVAIRCYAAQHLSGGQLICQIWLHTAFIRPGVRVLHFHRHHVDMPHKDKTGRRFERDFAVQLCFRSVPQDDGPETPPEQKPSTEKTRRCAFHSGCGGKASAYDPSEATSPSTEELEEEMSMRPTASTVRTAEGREDEHSGSDEEDDWDEPGPHTHGREARRLNTADSSDSEGAHDI